MDIDSMATRGHLIRQEEKADRDSRTEFAIDEFEDNFDELFARVEGGEMLVIIHTDGLKVCMVPEKQWIGSIRKTGLRSEQDV